jgi:hypothetical protein
LSEQDRFWWENSSKDFAVTPVKQVKTLWFATGCDWSYVLAARVMQTRFPPGLASGWGQIAGQTPEGAAIVWFHAFRG